MNRLLYRIYRLFSSVNYRARRRFTPAGWIVFTGLLLTGGMATDTDQSLGYQAFTLLLCLSAAAVAVAPFFRLRFTAERRLPKFGSAGQALHYTVSVRNGTKHSQPGLQLLDALVDPRPSFDEFAAALKQARSKSTRSSGMPDPRHAFPIKPGAVPLLAPGSEMNVELELVPLRRGVLHFHSVTLARTDPFVLFRGFSVKKLPGSITILPKRYSLPQINLPGSHRYQHGGVAFAASIGESEEFISLREYRPGDPMRRIHWRSWAKIGKPVVKEFQDEFFVRHALVLDTFANPGNMTSFEEAVSVAASFACTIDTQESLLDLLFVGPQAFSFTIGRGVAHADQMLEILASVKSCRDNSFSSLDQLVIEHASAMSGCIFILLKWDESRRQLVRKLGVLGIPMLVLIITDAGTRLERFPDDPEALHVLEVGKIEAELAKL